MQPTKIFEYSWDKDIFLLHVHFSCRDKGKVCSDIDFSRDFGDVVVKENVKMPTINTHRFIISKSKPNELGIKIVYSDDMILEAFIVDDRAYYPTASFYKS